MPSKGSNGNGNGKAHDYSTADVRPEPDSDADIRELVLLRRERERAIAALDSGAPETFAFEEEITKVEIVTPYPPAAIEQKRGLPRWVQILIAVATTAAPFIYKALEALAE